MTSEIVPFGKYKGKPVEDMLADAEYMAWLEAQPWFREKFKHLLAARDRDALNRTPEHNRLQALFLDRRYAEAFLRCADGTRLEAAFIKFANDAAYGFEVLVETAQEKDKEAERLDADKERFPWLAEQADEHRKKAAKLREDANRLAADRPKLTISSQFETSGADVLITASLQGLAPLIDTSGWGANKKTRAHGIDTRAEEFWLPIEIKPSVADEYPAVLRQMGRNHSRYLFVDRYTGEGATEEQFVAIFAASGKYVVFKREVDAEAERLRAGGAE